MNRFLPILLTALLGACTPSPPVRYHTLMSEAPYGSGKAERVVEILPVAIPERLDRQQIVLTPQAAGQLDLRDNDRWAAPISDELRAVVADALWRELRAADVYQTPTNTETVPHYRLSLHLERLEAGRPAIVQAVWTMRRVPHGVAVTCRASIETPVSGDKLTVDTAVSALSESVSRLGHTIAIGLTKLEQGAPDPCPMVDETG